MTDYYRNGPRRRFNPAPLALLSAAAVLIVGVALALMRLAVTLAGAR